MAMRNSPPLQLTERAVSVGAGKKTSINALTSWYDPDGDPFYLHKVSLRKELMPARTRTAHRNCPTRPGPGA